MLSSGADPMAELNRLAMKNNMNLGPVGTWWRGVATGYEGNMDHGGWWLVVTGIERERALKEVAYGG